MMKLYLAWIIPVLCANAAWAAASCEADARAYREAATPALKTRLESCGARLALGVAAVEAKAYPEALRQLRLAKTPALSDYVALYTALAYEGLGDKANTQKALAPIWKHQPASPLVPRAALLAARAAEPAEAVAILERYSGQLSQPSGSLALADAYLAAGQKERAGRYYAKVYFEYPLSAEAQKADLQWQALGRPENTPENHLIRSAKVLPAIPARARRDLEDVPGELAQVRRAAADYYAKQYPAALSALQGLELTDPAADAERTYYVYQAARRANRDDLRQSSLARLAKYHSATHWYLEALVAEGYRYLTDNDWKSYEPIYQACVDSFPADEKAAFCHWKLTWSAYIRRRPEAEKMLREHVERFPGSEKANAALYFLGRLEQDPAFYKVVAVRFPNTYYSLIASERLKERAPGSPKAANAAWLQTVKLPAAPTVPAQLSPATQARIERARQLLALGLDPLAESELRYGARGEDVPIHIAMELATALQRLGQVDRGLRTIKTLLPGYLNFPVGVASEQFWQLAFPMPYRLTLEKYARQAEIDPYVVAGLIRQESEFNAKVVSRSHAYGLTQILPSTGKDLSRRVGMKTFRATMLFDPTVNIHLGTYYIRNLLNSLEGNWHEALAAYNGGRTRVIKWRTFAEYKEPAEFIETIPFDETRGYVQAVLRNAAVYKQLYEGKPNALSYQDALPAANPAPVKSAVKPAAAKPRAKSKSGSARPVSKRKNR